MSLATGAGSGAVGPHSDVPPSADAASTETQPLEVVVVTGLSGAGKNSAGRVLEDLGWFVVDNLPPALLQPMVELGARGDLRRFAAVVDVRSRAFSSDLQEAIRVLAEAGHRPRVLYVHARDDVLIRRYESVRREHPLQGSGRLKDGIDAERALLTGIAGEADLWVDTSDLNVHQLRATLENAFAREGRTPPLTATVLSFGFKYGLPLDADLVVDARFLPNPHWLPELRPRTGQDPAVRDYVLGQEDAEPFLDRYTDVLRLLLPGYRREGKRYLTLAVGCTGGKHRSVAIAEEFVRRLVADGLAAALAAWRRITAELTAVVTVADDGGSSGRIRREMPVLPPGDLRMALTALADDDEHTREMAALLQHRLGGTGVLAGHPVGNLVLTGLTEMHGGDTVRALDDLCRLLGARGRVLPMADVPLDLVARVESVDPDDPRRTRTIRGQVAIATTPGRVREILVSPPDPPVSPAVLDAIAAADVVSLGPGSWYTSVLPHLLVPRLRAALAASAARVVVVLNLEPQVGETDGFSPEEHLRVLRAHLDGVALHTVIADMDSVVDPCGLLSAVRECGAELVLAPVAEIDGAPRHDPVRLSAALASVVGAR